jgi:hypothetical protein
MIGMPTSFDSLFLFDETLTYGDIAEFEVVLGQVLSHSV